MKFLAVAIVLIIDVGGVGAMRLKADVAKSTRQGAGSMSTHSVIAKNNTPEHDGRAPTVHETRILADLSARSHRDTKGALALESKKSVSKTFAGVAVRNYHKEATEWIVLFGKDSSDEDIRKFCGGHCKMMGSPSKGGVPFASVHGSSKEVESMVTVQTKHISLVEPEETDYAIPEIQGEMQHDGKASVASTIFAPMRKWSLERIGVPTRAFTGKGQTIYVQDTGVRFTHVDFGGRAFAGFDATRKEGGEMCDQGSTTCSSDRQGHGTHCAGSAAGATVGVASQAIVFSVKTLGDDGEGSRSATLAGIDYVATNGPKPSILSMSLGGRGRDPAFTDAVETAIAAGVTVVVAAGNINEDSCNFSPAFVPAAITVGAADNLNRRACYSNFGTCNDIMAPGSNIYSTSHDSDTGSLSLTGTSMACPHVSGAAALLLEEDSSLSSSQILSKLHQASRKDFLTETRDNDPRQFLWVGVDVPPPPVQMPPNADGKYTTELDEDCSSGGRKLSVVECEQAAFAFGHGWGGSTSAYEGILPSGCLVIPDCSVVFNTASIPAHHPLARPLCGAPDPTPPAVPVPSPTHKPVAPDTTATTTTTAAPVAPDPTDRPDAPDTTDTTTTTAAPDRDGGALRSSVWGPVFVMIAGALSAQLC